MIDESNKVLSSIDAQSASLHIEEETNILILDELIIFVSFE